MSTRQRRKCWISTKDIYAIDVNRRLVSLRSVEEPTDEQASELDVPVVRLNRNTYRLDRSRIAHDTPTSIYCATVTIN